MRQGMLGNCVPVVKKAIQFFPMVGWAMYFANSIFLTRNWKRDQKYLKCRATQLELDQLPVYVWLFAEGTRFTEKKRKEGEDFIKKRGIDMKPLQYLLVPRTKGFIALSDGLKSVVSHIYCITVAYEGFPFKKHPSPTMPELMFTTEAKSSEEVKKGRGVHVHVRRFKLKGLPSDEAKRKKWLMNLYSEKDKLLQKFHTKGCFEKNAKTLEPLSFNVLHEALLLWSVIGVVLLSSFLYIFNLVYYNKD
eukprot:g870.t1